MSEDNSENSASNSARPTFEVPADESADLLIGADDIDQILSEEDPEFLKGLDAVGQDKQLVAVDVVLSDRQQQLADEKNAWESATGIKKLFKFIPFIAHMSLMLKAAKFRFFAMLRSILVRMKNFGFFLRTEGKDNLINGFKWIFAQIKNFFGIFGNFLGGLSALGKLGFLVFLLGCAGTGYLIYRSATHGLIPQEIELFIPTMERLASDSYTYDPKTEVEPFYDNLRVSASLLLLPKNIVNLKPSKKSTRNPMAAFEFFAEGSSSEAVIELKDRETEVRDSIHRTLEEFTFEQVDTPEGKREVQEKVRRAINQILTQGEIRRIFIKTVVIKP